MTIHRKFFFNILFSHFYCLTGIYFFSNFNMVISFLFLFFPLVIVVYENVNLLSKCKLLLRDFNILKYAYFDVIVKSINYLTFTISLFIMLWLNGILFICALSYLDYNLLISSFVEHLVLIGTPEENGNLGLPESEFSNNSEPNNSGGDNGATAQVAAESTDKKETLSDNDSNATDSSKGKGKAIDKVNYTDSDFFEKASNSSLDWQDASAFDRMVDPNSNEGPSNYMDRIITNEDNSDNVVTSNMEILNKADTSDLDVAEESPPYISSGDDMSDIRSHRSELSPVSLDKSDSNRTSGFTNTQFDRRNLVDISLTKQDLMNRLSKIPFLSEQHEALRKAFKEPYAQEGTYHNSDFNIGRPHKDCIGCELIRQVFADAKNMGRWAKLETHAACGHDSLINSPCHNCHSLLKNVSWPPASDILTRTPGHYLSAEIKSPSINSVSDSDLRYPSSSSLSSSSLSSNIKELESNSNKSDK